MKDNKIGFQLLVIGLVSIFVIIGVFFIRNPKKLNEFMGDVGRDITVKYDDGSFNGNYMICLEVISTEDGCILCYRKDIVKHTSGESKICGNYVIEY